MSKHHSSVFAPKNGPEGPAKPRPAKEQKNDRKTSLAAKSIKNARERFKNFSLSNFDVDALPPNYVPHKPELPAAERIARVQKLQRKKIEQQLTELDGADSPNRGLRLALPTDAVKDLLPSYREKGGTLELSELMDLVSRHMRGTEFFNRGNPTLNRLTLHARVSDIIGPDEEENER
jgi:hypothetical protein